MNKKELIKEKYLNGVSGTNIAIELNIRHPYVYKILNELNIPRRSRQVNGKQYELMQEGKRKCPTCNTIKSIDSFPRDNSGFKSRCKECHSKAERLNLPRRRERVLEREYGISKDEYDLLLLNQGNKCAICKLNTKLNVDHCHMTSKVRGLLCQACNKGLGFSEIILVIY